MSCLTLAACGDASKKPNLFGIPLPSFSSSEPDLSDRERRQLELFDRTLHNPSMDIDPQTRQQAAEELIAMDVTEATATLGRALESGEPAVVMAVIDAMEDWPEPVEGLLPAATETLRDVPDEQLEKLALVLPRYGSDALNRVAALARDRNQPPAQRTGPIYALSAFRSREAAVVLMSLLEEPPPEPPEIVAATGASLERLTGLPYGADAGQWRRWWDQLRNEPIEDWLRIMVLHLSTRTSELERQINAQGQEYDEIAQRLTEALRELFLSLSADQQLERLPILLSDPLHPVRDFALGRVERRLRDSERIPDPVQVKLAERLNDPAEAPASRLLAARLLNDLNYQGTAYQVAAALTEESDPAHAASYLDILAKRPAPSALEQILRWLDDSTAGEAAAGALWSMVSSDLIVPEMLPAVRESVRGAMEWGATPALVRVLGAVGDPDDRESVESLLDSQDPAQRRAAAEGLAYAGQLEPLLARASDDDIYPFVIRVLARGPAGVETVAALVELPPPDAHRQEWAQTIKTAAEALDAPDLLAADDALAAQPHVDAELRAEILSRAAQLPADAVTMDQRSALLVRLAQLRLALGEYQGAYEVLARPNGALTSVELAELRFEVAVLAGHYDDANTLNADVTAWIALLNELIDRRPQAAAVILEEIRRRFPEELEGEAGELFRAADERLTHRTVSAGDGSGSSE